MKSKRYVAALLAAMLLLGSFAGLAGCKDTTVQNPPPVSENNTVKPETQEPKTVIAAGDAQSIADERLPEGYVSEDAGTAEADGKSYYLFAVKGADGADVGTVAIDQESGERYSYDGEKVTEYADFPLYNAATDAVYDWNGVFKTESTSVELLQEDANSFEFSFADGTQGIGRIKGNTAQTDDGTLIFTFENEKTLLVGGENAALAGTYVKAEA